MGRKYNHLKSLKMKLLLRMQPVTKAVQWQGVILQFTALDVGEWLTREAIGHSHCSEPTEVQYSQKHTSACVKPSSSCQALVMQPLHQHGSNLTSAKINKQINETALVLGDTDCPFLGNVYWEADSCQHGNPVAMSGAEQPLQLTGAADSSASPKCKAVHSSRIPPSSGFL